MASLRITPDIEIPSAALTWRFSRSSGPGGQSVNTSDSRVELIFDLQHSDAFPAKLHARALQRLNKEMVDGAIVVTSSRYRSQLSNRDDAQRKLVKCYKTPLPRLPPRGARRDHQRPRPNGAWMKRTTAATPRRCAANLTLAIRVAGSDALVSASSNPVDDELDHFGLRPYACHDRRRR